MEKEWGMGTWTRETILTNKVKSVLVNFVARLDTHFSSEHVDIDRARSQVQRELFLKCQL